ncbi:ATP-dependent DNA helicase [Trichonephila clavipes]|nr:ATP-dependent DNA helicase [Trichonephila clavipes]
MQVGTTDPRGRSHPPQCTTSCKERQIVSMALTDLSVASRTVAQHIESVTHHSVSPCTIRRRLQQSGLSARRPLLGLPFTQHHRRLRHKWCGEKRILETPWREDAEQLRYAPPHWSCTVYYGMGGIGYPSRTPLVRIASTLNSQRYISEMLEPFVFPYLQVVWVEGHASFDTEKGLHQLNQECSWDLPPKTSELHDLIKKNQLHKYIHMCYKNSSESPACKLGFPRKECAAVRLLSHSSDEFIRNGGRICILKQGPEDGWVNNYNPILIEVWNANMDIQLCGTNEVIALYIAKYVSKSEPTQLNHSVAQAIRQVQREETDILRKLFKVCMRILKEGMCLRVNMLIDCPLNFRESSRK